MGSEWSCFKIKDLAIVKRGSSPRPINEFIVEPGKGYPWLKISDFSLHDRYVYKTKEFLHPSGLKNTRFVKKGTLICTNSATPGIPIFLGEDMCLHDGFLYFETISDKVDKYYLYYYLIANRTNLVGLGNGSVFVNLKKEILENYQIMLPPLETQKKIASILNCIDDKIERNKKINDNLSIYNSTESTSISPDSSLGINVSLRWINILFSRSINFILFIDGIARSLNLNKSIA